MRAAIFEGPRSIKVGDRHGPGKITHRPGPAAALSTAASTAGEDTGAGNRDGAVAAASFTRWRPGFAVPC
jgi:hypothetical protein